jgi:hypothetical protein
MPMVSVWGQQFQLSIAVQWDVYDELSIIGGGEVHCVSLWITMKKWKLLWNPTVYIEVIDHKEMYIT